MNSVWIPKVAAFLAALAVAYAAKRGFTLDTDQVTVIFVAVLGIVKTVLGRYMNPGNVNAPELVEPQRREVAQARAMRQANERHNL